MFVSWLSPIHQHMCLLWINILQMFTSFSRSSIFNHFLSFKVLAAVLIKYKCIQLHMHALPFLRQAGSGQSTTTAAVANYNRKCGCARHGRSVFSRIHQGLEKMRNDRNSLQIRNKSFHETELFSSTKKPKLRLTALKITSISR